MDFLRFIVFDILGVTPLLVGFIALIGLLIQRKPIEKVLSGTFKTIVGFLVFAGGAGLAVTSLGNFQTLFSDGFGLKGVMPLAEALTGLAQTKFAMCVSLIMVIGFGWNLFFARVTPFKYIFLTGQHNLYLSALLTVTLKALGYSDMTTIIVGSVLLGLAACLYPAIAQPWMRKITGNDEIAMGHYVTLAYAASGWIGSKVGDPKQSTEKLNLPGWLGIFKDYIVSVSISVSIFYYIAALAAGKAAVTAAAGGMHWLVYPLFQSLTFTAWVFAIIGDGEMHEGQIWETLQQAGHMKMDNLVAIFDYNGFSSHDPVNAVVNLEPLADKIRCFGWHVLELHNGNDMHQVADTLMLSRHLKGKPVAIVAHTTKGSGVSYMENNGDWHSKTPSKEQYQQAMEELQ